MESYLHFCLCLCIWILLDCEQTRQRQQLTRLQRRCVEMQTLVRSARRDFRMKQRALPTPTPQRERRQTVPIFQSNQTGRDGDLFVTFFFFFITDLFWNSSYLGPFHLFCSNFLGNVLLPCVYTIKLESCLPTWDCNALYGWSQQKSKH